MYQIYVKIIKFLSNAMKGELIAGGKTLALVRIQRGIFQRDALSPLLFVITMTPIYFILMKCTGDIDLQNRR